MADADEDQIKQVPGTEEDVSDEETPDWTNFALISKSKSATIPKRGEKDFESHGTTTQQERLDAQRQAMHDVLAYERHHLPSKHSIATYYPPTKTAYIDSAHGPLFKSMGRQLSPRNDPLSDRHPNPNRIWLLPEEILYLIERGSVDCRWPAQPEDAYAPGIPMSLQAAWACFMGLDENSGLSFERYSVYSYLRRGGYMVQRAPEWQTATPTFAPESFPPVPGTTWVLGLAAAATAFRNMWSSLSGTERSVERGPLVKQRIYRSYADIYRRLSITLWYNPKEESRRNPTPRQQDLRVAWHVWKPSNAAYKKSKPPPPDFRIAVVDARATGLPLLADLSGLIENQPYIPPPESMFFYAKLKHGHKSIILAVVDQGVTSFIKLADAAFGLHPRFNWQTKPVKGKGGGRKGPQKR